MQFRFFSAPGLAFLLLVTLYSTTAAQSGWHRVDLGVREYNGLHFINDHEGWLTGRFAGGISKVLHTTDAGAHWSQVGPDRLWDTTGNLSDSSYSTIYFFDSLHGFVNAGYDDDHLRDIILRTADGGNTWILTTPGIYRVNAFLMIANGRLAAIGQSTISMTSDSGDTWVDLLMGDGTSFFNTIASADGIHVMAGGDEGTYRDTLPPYGLYDKALMFQSSNNGVRWMETPRRFLHGVQQIVALDSTTFLVFSITTVYKTTDFGASWATINTGAPLAILSASFSSPRVGIAVGRSGTIIRTTDGGETWANQASGVGNELVKVAMLNDTVGFAIGYSGTLISTTTGGVASANSSGLSELSSIHLNPSPARDETLVTYTLASPDRVTITLVNSEGVTLRIVAPSTIQEAGTHRERIELTGLPSGAYTVRISGAHASRVAKLTVVR